MTDTIQSDSAADASYQTGADDTVRAEHVEISQGSAGNVEATTVSVRQGAVARVRASDVSVGQGAVALAQADRLHVADGASVLAVATDQADVAAGASVFLLIARRVTGDVRPVLDWRAAAAFGAGFALVLRFLRR